MHPLEALGNTFMPLLPVRTNSHGLVGVVTFSASPLPHSLFPGFVQSLTTVCGLWVSSVSFLLSVGLCLPSCWPYWCLVIFSCLPSLEESSV